VVATSAFGERELALAGACNISRVPLGVDLEVFRPRRAPRPAAPLETVRLVYAGRLSTEKNPRVAVDAIRVLRRWGIDARLDVYGSGPQDGALRRRAACLPVAFHGHVAERSQLAKHIAHADLVLAPAACETFGLAVLEALACGIAVVAAAGSGAAELVSREPGGASPGAGVAVAPNGAGMAEGVLELLSRPAGERAAAARARASQFPWSASVGRMLAIHGGDGPARRAADGLRIDDDRRVLRRGPRDGP